jgi:hypothetical protein
MRTTKSYIPLLGIWAACVLFFAAHLLPTHPTPARDPPNVRPEPWLAMIAQLTNQRGLDAELRSRVEAPSAHKAGRARPRSPQHPEFPPQALRLRDV